MEKTLFPVAVYPNDRWRSYMMNLVNEREGKMHIPLYANYLCRNWNDSHSTDKQLLSFNIYFMLEEFPGKSLLNLSENALVASRV